MRKLFRNNFPVGYNPITEVIINLIALLMAIILDIFTFQCIFRENLEKSGLSEFGFMNKDITDINHPMPSFMENQAAGLNIFLVCIFLQFIWMGIHYYYHFIGDSRSIYLMRRLPDSSQLYRRCILIPILMIFIYILAAGIVAYINCRNYLEITPSFALKSEWFW